LSQTQLAKDAGTTQAIISNLENGDYNPSIDLLARIAQALGVDTSLLIREALDRELIESISYFISKLTKKPLDILKAMKLLYFTDLIALSKRNEKLSHLQYIRRNR
jgi:transcriptional regulator with XRE-family HTH domain